MSIAILSVPISVTIQLSPSQATGSCAHLFVLVLFLFCFVFLSSGSRILIQEYLLSAGEESPPFIQGKSLDEVKASSLVYWGLLCP